jgi:phenylacetate-CoA ligase
MKKLITVSIFRIYDLFQGHAITSFYEKAKAKNTLSSSENINNDLKSYFQKWGFKEDITQNALMKKQDIKNWVQKVDKNQVHSWAYTGGSYGEPLKVPYSKERSFIRTATFKYFNELGKYNLGDSFALIRAKNKSKFIKFLRNETIIIPHDISESKLNDIFSEIIDKKVKVLMGYPTVMYEMALFLSKNQHLKKRLHVQSLISVSEMLEFEKREVIREQFNCNFIDRYSNEEVGLIAQQKEFGGKYFVNKYGVYVEVLDPFTLLPVAEGETGKVVVTDINNDLIPVIRYDTGDLAIVDKYQDGHLHTLSAILGREVDKLFDVNNKPISSLFLGPYIYKPLANKGYVNQFQLAQIDSGIYELRIKKEKQNPDSETLEVIKNNLNEVLGRKAVIKFTMLNDIPALPSGKRPVYKNEMLSKS